ncbi:MAG: hypothetical protein ACXVZV_11780 [Terriglobales bacterium]
MTGLTAEFSPGRKPWVGANQDTSESPSGGDRITLVLFLLVSLILCVAPSAFAANWTAPATDLAKAVAGATGPGNVTLAVTNSSSLSKADVVDIQHTLETQLRSSDVRIVSGSTANSDVRVTLSENLQGYVWVAEIKQGNETQVEMVSVPRTEAPAVPHSGPSVSIRKTLLWSQPTPILDAYVDDKRMVLLDAASVSTLALHDGKWQPEQTIAINASHSFPRDLRGLLVPMKDRLADVYLPGTMCNVAAGSSGIALSCRDSDDPWPFGPRSALFNSGRNYFTGVLFPAVNKPPGPFYSVVALPRSGYNLLALTAVDGRVHLNDGTNDQVLSPSTTADWGSDIAALKSSCGAGTQILVTSAGDDTATESLRAFEIPDREAVQVSAAADFPGPITALWTHGDGSSVTAVAHHLRTGRYEAYSVSVTCNQ